MSEVVSVAKITVSAVKNIFLFLKEKKWADAGKEFVNLIKTIYVEHLKGKYLEIKGKKIPATAVLFIVLAFLYVITPSCGSKPNAAKVPEVSATTEAPAEKAKAPAEEAKAPAEEAKAPEGLENNAYDKDGIKVYGLAKCEKGVCGILENSGEKSAEEVKATITFYDGENVAVYRSTAVASNLEPTAKAEFSVSCEVDFASYKLTSVDVKMAE